MIERGAIGHVETQVGARAVTGASMRDGLRRNIQPEHLLGGIGKQSRSVTLATGGIEHAQAVRERARKRVAMHVLVPDFAHTLGREALTGEFK